MREKRKANHGLSAVSSSSKGNETNTGGSQRKVEQGDDAQFPVESRQPRWPPTSICTPMALSSRPISRLITFDIQLALFRAWLAAASEGATEERPFEHQQRCCDDLWVHPQQKQRTK